MNRSMMTQQWQDALVNQPDFLREIVQTTIQKVLDSQFQDFLGVLPYERSPERRGIRNGSYPRQLKTRVGTIELNVCRDRDGEFRTDLFERYQRSEKALALSLLEMYLWGISTRKVKEITEMLCGFGVSKSHISDLAKILDHDLAAWRERKLTEEYPYLIFDARYEKIRENGRVISKAVALSVGITSEGKREIIGCWVINSESFEEWDTCIEEMVSRGLQGVRYVVSDQNKGLRAAIEKKFQRILWQRCQVHFMRNFLSKLSKSMQSEAMRLVKSLFLSDSKEEAHSRLEKLREYLQGYKKESVWDWVEENIEETFAVFELPLEHRRRMRSTNMLERLNQELKRRSRVVRIFANVDSCLRLMTALCQEHTEEWSQRRYI